MNDADRFVVFTIDQRRLALPLTAVARVVRMVAVTPLPQAPAGPTLACVRGVINVEGQVLPVLDLRPCLGLPLREPEPSDQLLLTHTPQGLAALVADTVEGVVTCAVQEMTANAAILSGLPGAADVAGVAQVGEDLVLIQDPARLFLPSDVAAAVAALDVTALDVTALNAALPPVKS